MTKKQHIAALRLSPLGEEGVSQIRKIVEERKYRKVNEVMVDVFTASAFIAVYDAVNDANKEKLRGKAVFEACDIALRVINKANAEGRAK
jgi:translation initiation factor 2 alpha subunit (eIF-2alpha)